MTDDINQIVRNQIADALERVAAELRSRSFKQGHPATCAKTQTDTSCLTDAPLTDSPTIPPGFCNWCSAPLDSDSAQGRSHARRYHDECKRKFNAEKERERRARKREEREAQKSEPLAVPFPTDPRRQPDFVRSITKECVACRTSKPLTEYRVDTNNKDGLRNECRVCETDRRYRERRQRKSNHDETKRCKLCGNVRSINRFNEDPGAPDGRSNICRPCINGKQAIYKGKRVVREKLPETEDPAIAKFIAEKGVTRCPPAACAAVTGGIETKGLTHYDEHASKASHRFPGSIPAAQLNSLRARAKKTEM